MLQKIYRSVIARAFIALVMLVAAFTPIQAQAINGISESAQQAADGDLDSTFGTGGIVTTDFDSNFDFGSSVAIQADGRIIVGGEAMINGNYDFALARYMPDGSLDTTFDGDGRVTTDFAGQSDHGNAVALQAAGGILLAGISWNQASNRPEFALARYNSDGSLDTTFDMDGKVTTPMGQGGYCAALAVQPDGKIVAVGEITVNNASDFALVRYNIDGSLDTGFGVNGIVITDFGNSDDGHAIIIQPSDGRIIVAGGSYASNNASFVLARYNSNGSLDTTFDSDGKVITSIGSYDHILDLALQLDGKILAAGKGDQISTGRDFVLVRYNSDGSLDSTFGLDGKVTTNFGSDEDGSAVAVQPDGRILVAGVGDNRTTLTLARYLSNGSLDQAFGIDGKVTTSVTDRIVGNDLVLQPDHNIIVAGACCNDSNVNFMVARYINHSELRILYVNKNAAGADNGTSWTDAYTDLQSALAVANSGDEIWVAAGTYKPTADTNRARAFVLERGVALYGGFAGTETSLTQRDPSANITVLSGDIGAADDIRDNSHHVVVNHAVDGMALLDGFTITLGNANDPAPELQGGGIRNEGALSISDSLVIHNSSDSGGGGVHNLGELKITDSVFSNNSSLIGAGLLNGFDANLEILGSTFSNNSAQQSGGGIYSYGFVEISNSLIFGNSATDLGGGIYSYGPLQMSESVVSNNTSSFGGGIVCYGDSNIVESTISDNSATEGGGINNVKMLNLENSLISGNSATYGGGISSSYGNLNIVNSTVSDNSALETGGGIMAQEPALTITGSTFAGNSASGGGAVFISYGGEFNSINNTFFNNSAVTGGGVSNIASTLNIINNTFSDNSADTGGGLYNLGTLNYVNSILANSITGEDCYNSADTGGIVGLNVNNLVETNGVSPFACGLPGLTAVDPGLGTLSNNSGLTQTMALLPGSPAIDAGSDMHCPLTDQRGMGRPQGSHCDIGAYEYIPAAPVTWTVTKTADTDDGICDTDCSLREAITSSYQGDMIKFAVTGTILLASDLPMINKALVVDGGSQGIRIDGAGSHRIFKIEEAGDLTIKNLVLQNGHSGAPCMEDVSQSCGGAIYNNGSLSSLNVTFQGNTADIGGAIFIESGTTNIENNTFTDNLAVRLGGAILNWIGTLDVVNSSFQGNAAAWDGGAIYNDISTLTLINNTFSNNAAARGGAVYNSAGDLAFVNNILANSTAGDDCFNEDPYATISSNVHNLIETNAAAPNNCGISALTSDPMLGALASNGGPTQTMALLTGSPAIDAGDDASCPATDQRGTTRPYGNHCDIGAYEKTGGALPLKPTFTDAPMTHPYWQDIEILYANGYTGGCATSPLKFCPDQIMDRAQAAVFMMRGANGADYVPNPATFKFQDNWSKALYARTWAEAMRETNLTTGCQASPLLYCPMTKLTREQAMIFALKMKYGNYYLPPAATGKVFADMNNPGYWATAWAEKAYADGLIQACGMSGGRPKICPGTLVTRGLGAYMIVKAKNLTMP